MNSDSSFELIEATVANIHRAFKAGKLTCAELIRLYLARIEAYDSRGPKLKSILHVNPNAVAEAVTWDSRLKRDPSAMRPLHGIPIVLKDNFNTFDMPTTGGNSTLRHSMPLEDAFTVKKLRAAGVVIVAKTNLTELARGGVSVSGLGGQSLNPYDLTRTPGGSSGGTGAAIAANFATVGTGSDTLQSIRSPASANCLIGIRPTRGLISRNGLIPFGSTLDEAGPIARSVEDAARLFEIMVGYDPADPVTACGVGKTPKSYLDEIGVHGLKGARIGVMLDMFGNDAVLHDEVNRVIKRAIGMMEDLGAAMTRFYFPDYASVSTNVDNAVWEAKAAFDAYLEALGPEAPVRTLADLVASGVHPAVLEMLQQELAIEDGLNSPEYKGTWLRRDKFRVALNKVMTDLNIDAILYPHQRRLVARVGEPQLERNGEIARGTGFPAITFPAGFSDPSPTAPLGVPIGVELLGREYSEPMLFKFAYAFEQGTKLRKPPEGLPFV